MIGDGGFVAAQVTVRISSIAVSFGKIWFQSDGLVMIGDGGFVAAQFVLCNAPVVVGFGKIWL